MITWVRGIQICPQFILDIINDGFKLIVAIELGDLETGAIVASKNVV